MIKEESVSENKIENKILLFQKKGDEKIRNEILTSEECEKIISCATAPFSGCSFHEDLKQDAIFGIVKAINNYKKDGNFVPYALSYAKNEIYKKYYSYTSDVKASMFAIRNRKKVKDFKNNFIQENGREPSTEEVSDGLNMRGWRIDNLQNINDATGVPIEYLENCKEYSVPFGMDSENEDDFSLMHSMMKSLSDIQKDVLFSSFGVGREQETMDKIGARIGKTKQRVSQIRTQALTKLKSLICD